MKNKKYFLTFLLIAIIGFAIYFFNNASVKNSKQSNAMLAVPERTAAFIVSDDILSLNTKLDSLNYLKQLEESLIFSNFRNQLFFIDSLSNQYSEYLKINQVVFTLNNSGSSKLGFLSILALDESISLAEFKKILKLKYNAVTEYKFQDEEIITVEKENQKLSFSVFNNLLLFSAHAPLIEESINNLKKEIPKTNTEEFKKLAAETTNSDLQVFIDYNSISDLSTIVFNTAYLKTLESDLKNVSWSKTAINFNEADIDFKNTYAYIDYIAKTGVVPFSLDKFLPNNTAYFKAIQSKGNKIFHSNDISYKFFSPWLDQEIAFFSIETFDEDYQKRIGLVLKATNIDTAKVNLYLLNKEMKPVDSYENMAIYEMNVDAISKIFKDQFFSFQKPYFAFIGNYVVFANDMTVLRTCYQKFKGNKFLKADLVFQDFIQSENTTANRISYINPQRWQSTIQFMFNPDIVMSNFGKTKLETLVTDTTVYSVGKISFNKENIKKTTKIWELSLDTISSFKPQIVINADNKRKEIITQDKKNNIYLVNQSGEILFKKKIDEKIIGNIYQIDIFKSGKLQYVFNTSSYIYVMDRKGSLVNGFPLKLPSASSNGMLVVNYDKAKIYRYFVACKNGNIYGYEASGKPLNSWSPLGNFGEVSNQLKHTAINGKDYIYFNNDAGTFYAVNRKGENRFEPINFNSSFFQPFEKTKDGFINLGEGSIYKVNTTGKTTAKIVGDTNYVHFANFVEKEAFAIANQKEFRVAKSKWTLLGKRGINDEIVSIAKEKIQNKIWFLVQGKKSVYLINDLGEIHPDFPMLSNSAARIEKFINSKNEMLILNEGIKLKAFELVVPE